MWDKIKLKGVDEMSLETMLESAYKSVDMGISSIEDVVVKAEDKTLKKELESQLLEYKRFKEELVHELNKIGVSPKGTGTISKIYADFMVSMKLMTHEKDETILEMMLKGTEMGINELESHHELGESELATRLINFYKTNLKNLNSLANK